MLRVAMCQMAVTPSKSDNIAKALRCIATAATQHRAQLVVLPECFNCPYGTKHFAEYAEEIWPFHAGGGGVVPTAKTRQRTRTTEQSPTVEAMMLAAKEHSVWLVAGSIPEIVSFHQQEAKEGGAGQEEAPQIFNSSMFIDPTGKIVNVHRKIHLFRINTDTVKMDEGLVLTAGNEAKPVTVTVSPHPGDECSSSSSSSSFVVGQGICFDIRYPQLAMHYQQNHGSHILVYPGAFNMVTGPVHWKLAAMSRAVDTQQYVCLCSVARDTADEYVAWGHSMLVDPWGEILCEAGHGEEIVCAEVSLERIADVRRRVPIHNGTREKELYHLASTM